MKKIISLAIATALMFSMAAVAFAADSVTDTSSSVIAPAADGISGSVSVAPFTGNTTEATEKVEAEEATKTVDSVYAFDLNLSDNAEINAADGTFSVTVKVIGINYGDSIKVLHYTSDYGWKEETASVNASGQVVISGLTGLSPFVVIKYGSATTSTSSSNTVNEVEGGWYDENGYHYPSEIAAAAALAEATATTTVASPKTGEGNVVAVAMSVMLVAGVAACGLLRKKEEN